MKKLFYSLMLFFVSGLLSNLLAQTDKVPSYFGIQVRPVFPSSTFRNKEVKLSDKEYSLKMTQVLGYSFGATVRAGITKLIAFESGINFIQRYYNTEMTVTDTAITASDKLTFVSYEIPVNLLVYIPLTPAIYMNASMGGAIRYSPTDVEKLTLTESTHSFYNKGYYSQKIGLNVNGNVGFEYRTKKKGFYYIGGCVAIPLKPILYLRSIHEIQQVKNPTILDGNVNGSYLALELKYIFPTIRQKGEQPKQGPIEQ